MRASRKDEKYSRILGRQHRCAELANVNYCIPGVMSRCSAGLIWREQKRCKYAIKSTVSDRCMHYIKALNGHCDSVDAQRSLNRMDRMADK